ncbi:MAG: hypothetical protein Kow0037_03880 [Calditrichia bacterium]
MQETSYLTELLIAILLVLSVIIIYYYTRKYRESGGERNLYLEALEHMINGEEKKAIQKFKESVRDDSENINAYLYLGDLLRRRGLTNNALRIHHDLTLRSNLTQDFQYKVYRSLMLDYEVLDDYPKAIEFAKKLVARENIFFKEAISKLISFYEKQLDWENALDVSKKYLKPQTPATKKQMALYLVFMGKELMGQEKGRDARLKFKEALKLDPECAAAYYYLGKSYYEEERLSDALKEWLNLTKKIPAKSHIAFKMMEKAWFESGNFFEAENLYNDLISKDSRNIQAAIALTNIYDKKGDHDRALEILDRLLTLHPDVETLRIQKIRILTNKGESQKAAMLALDLLGQNPTYNPDVFFCDTCQYKSEEPEWLCPQCKKIDSFNI